MVSLLRSRAQECSAIEQAIEYYWVILSFRLDAQHPPNCYSNTLSVESWMYWPLHVPNSNTDIFIFHHLTCVRLTRRRSESLFLATALANVSKSRESQGPASYFEQRSDTMTGNPRSVACTQNFERLPRKSFFGLRRQGVWCKVWCRFVVESSSGTRYCYTLSFFWYK